MRERNFVLHKFVVKKKKAITDKQFTFEYYYYHLSLLKLFNGGLFLILMVNSLFLLILRSNVREQNLYEQIEAYSS